MTQQLISKRMLFLEDDEELSRMMIPIFKVFVTDVLYARTINEAHMILETQSIDLIFTDIHLKNENGLNFVKEVRNADERMPIVVLSSYKDEALLMQAIPLGLIDYLIKPVNYLQLTEAFDKCFAKIECIAHKKIDLGNGFIYDANEQRLVRDNEIFVLKKKEILFVELLSKNRNRLITKEMIEASVWESEEMSDAALYNFILRIRNRFGKDFIHAISNLGYRVSKD
ncbi:MAG: response regulator [Sulfurospirillaceae bacterium]|nr:response regulator [Sulfurospirillaceae bacterium]MDD2827924.1 response regulator [Sulfurospirillaceae bacterium]